jgi:hypothetical protein
MTVAGHQIKTRAISGPDNLKHGRREIPCLAATAHPSAEWISRQLMEGPCYLLRDRDSVYGEVFIRRSCDGYSGSADRGAVAMAEWLL